jgi:hypothetical protein
MQSWSCSVHPDRALVATCSGQRVFPVPLLTDEEKGENEGKYEEIDSITKLDNSLKLWTF